MMAANFEFVAIFICVDIRGGSRQKVKGSRVKEVKELSEAIFFQIGYFGK